VQHIFQPERFGLECFFAGWQLSHDGRKGDCWLAQEGASRVLMLRDQPVRAGYYNM
jgi:hypothetical protein